MLRLICLLIAALTLNGCFDSGGGSKSPKEKNDSNTTNPISVPPDNIGPPDEPITTPPVTPQTPPVDPPTIPPIEPPSTASPAHLLDVYLAQTHVLRPEDRFFRLVAGRDVLFIARVENDNQTLAIEVLDHLGGLLGNLALKGPEQLDKTAGNGPAPFTLGHSARIPGNWVHPGMQIRLLHGQQQLTLEHPSVGAPNVLTYYSVPFVLFGRTLDSLPPDGLAMSHEHREEYAARLPVNRFDYRAMPPLLLDRLVLEPNDQSPGLLLPVWPDCPRTQSQSPECDVYRAMGGILAYLDLLKTANGEGDIAHYYGLVFNERRMQNGYSEIWGGLGGGDVGVGDSWLDVMHHEMGHAYGLGHAGEDFQEIFDRDFNSHFSAGSKQFPYAASSPGDSRENGNVGDTWGYDLNRREFIPPYLYNSDGSIRQHKQDPMQSGAGHREAGYLYSMFADAYVSRIQTHLEGYINRLGKIHYDAATNRLLRWNYDQNRYDPVPYPTPCTQRPACYGPGDIPIEHDVPVITLIGSISRTTSELNLIHPPYSRNGNLIRLYDPTLIGDLQELREHYNWYCADAGCQYVLRLSERIDGQLRHRHILLRAGFFEWHQWERNILKAGADNPNSGDSFTRWSVNIRPQGNLEKVEILFKDQAQQGLLSGEGEVVASWTAP